LKTKTDPIPISCPLNSLFTTRSRVTLEPELNTLLPLREPVPNPGNRCRRLQERGLARKVAEEESAPAVATMSVLPTAICSMASQSPGFLCCFSACVRFKETFGFQNRLPGAVGVTVTLDGPMELRITSRWCRHLTSPRASSHFSCFFMFCNFPTATNNLPLYYPSSLLSIPTIIHHAELMLSLNETVISANQGFSFHTYGEARLAT
jgi:hypothetical protein